MKKTILLIAATTLLSSCGTFKRIMHKEETTSSVSSTVQAVETKTVTERVDTVVHTKPDSVHAAKSLKDIAKGDTLHAETDKTVVDVYYDPTTGKLHANAKSKPQIVPITFERTTVSDTKTNKVEVSEQSRKVRDVDKERKSGSSGYLWGIITILALIIVLYILYRYIKTLIKPF